jgi:N-acetylmuramoyl-L-alanine amidase
MFKKTIVLFLIFTSLLVAQDFSGIRIYINPGHGGHDPANDRFIPETGFWESEGNLSKGLHLKSILESLNATTKISRTTNNDNDDLSLSVISADANNFGADYFQSIHSNATGIATKRNTTLILFRGYDSAPVYPGSKTMGNLLVDEIYKAHRTLGTSVRGDWDFYDWGTSGLGVLRGLTMPGTLSEGSFHDYIPESWRLKNNAYLKHESWAITKAFISYFNLTPLPYGEIAGILRDPFELVSYYSISGTSDNRKPLNLGKAVLMPDSIVYEGDSFNNGFYLLDKVMPGTYDLILEAEDYEKDTIEVTVSANKTTFKDKYLIPKPNFSPPLVNSYSPAEAENVRLDSDIILEFSVKMDRNSVEQSFSISPNVIGSFSWESNDRKLIFSPSTFLQGGTIYNISVNSFAKSAYDVFIEQPFSHTFLTRSALSLVNAYPDQNSTDISTTVKIKLKFDGPIDDFSLGGNIFFKDMDENNINLYIDEIDYDNGRIIFEPRDPLANNSSYQIILLSGIKDVEGSNLNSDTTIVFTTEPNLIKEGTTLSDFELIGDWWQPEQSGSTTGIDVDNTSFVISTKRAVDGENTGKLTYSFSDDSAGVCRIYNQSEPELNANTNIFGMWVFGDLSYNILEYWFRDNQENNMPIIIDTLNWTGWKFKEVDLTSVSNLKFHSIVIKQNNLGEKTGQIYFDAMLMDVITDVNKLNEQLPTNFKLDQNYPNPFNPTTTIKYSIPNVAADLDKSVTLTIYDVLGREIKTLVNKVQSTGNYEVTFDASDLSSGVYYYQLKTGDFIKTKKMLLLK